MARSHNAVTLNSGRIRLSGRMVYPDILEPRELEDDNGNKVYKYQLTILIPKSADISDLKAALAEVREEHFSKAQMDKVKLPLIPTHTQDRFADYADEYPIMIRTSANVKFPPQVVDHRMNLVTAEKGPDEVYGGRWCFATVNPYKWENKKGGIGISLGLNNVQLLEHDDNVGGGHVRAESEFEVVDLGEGDNADEIFKQDASSDNSPVNDLLA